MKNSIRVSQIQKSSAKSINLYQPILLKLTVLLLSVLFAFPGNSQDTLKRGVYKTFEEFKNNAPTFAHSFYVSEKERKRKKWKGTFSYTPRFTETDQKIKKVWGFCDGTTVYIYHQKEFFPIEMKENYLEFFGYGNKKRSSKEGKSIMKAGAKVAGAGFFDPTGIVAAGTLILSAPIILTGGIVAISTSSNYKKQKVEYSIDPINGQIH
jgi:hypothetical protein